MMLDSNLGHSLKSFHFWMYTHYQFGFMMAKWNPQRLFLTMELILTILIGIKYMVLISFWMFKGQNIEEKLIHLYNYFLKLVDLLEL